VVGQHRSTQRHGDKVIDLELTKLTDVNQDDRRRQSGSPVRELGFGPTTGLE
jgi:hypothetical protein